MKDPKFIQIHALTSYPGVLLNRDDAGFAKRLPFGGVTRTRVSSQCLKRHWRRFEGQHALYDLEVPRSWRSRLTFQKHIVEALAALGYPEGVTSAVTAQLMDKVLGKSERKKVTDEKTLIRTPQITVLGEPEVNALRKVVRDILDAYKEEFEAFWDVEDAAQLDKKSNAAIAKAFKDTFKDKALKKNLDGMRLAMGLDAAMFGRMVTSDILSRGDAAVHVAHALTVHEEASETDYFSAVDDILAENSEGELGSGHINNTELNSGLFYLYVVIDVPLLVSNLEGCAREAWAEADRRLAAEVVRRFIHLMATVTPGAKLGSTAPHSYAECMLVEVGDAQPRTLANAFRAPVRQRPGDVLHNSYEALVDHIADFHQMYGRSNAFALSARGDSGSLQQALEVTPLPLVDTAAWVASLVEGS